MTTEVVLPPCTVCGEPAVCVVRDVIKIYGDMYIQYKPMGGFKPRCAKHGESRTFQTVQYPPFLETGEGLRGGR